MFEREVQLHLDGVWGHYLGMVTGDIILPRGVYRTTGLGLPVFISTLGLYQAIDISTLHSLDVAGQK